MRHKRIQPYIEAQIDPTRVRVDPAMRGHIKQALLQIGYPAEDLAGYVDGESLTLHLRLQTLGGLPFGLRQYQHQAAEVFHASGSARGGPWTQQSDADAEVGVMEFEIVSC